MAISRKPKPDASSAIDVDALIAKGGSVPQNPLEESSGSPSKAASFTLRVPPELLAQLDTHLKSKPYRVPRQQWILEAVIQRLEREASLKQ